MASFIVRPDLSPEEKLNIMRETADMDVSEYDGEARCGISQRLNIENIKAPPPPGSPPKLGISGDCIFNCQYCGGRCGVDRQRTTFTPEEAAKLAFEAAKKSGQGVFITSAVYKNPNCTEEMIVETARLLREKYNYNEYMHAKVMPGASPVLIEKLGWYADRMSVNVELSHSSHYKNIAKQKSRETILGPTGDISRMIKAHAGEKNKNGRFFARSGQTTQMIVGACGETDREIMTLAQAMYNKYGLRRFYYSPFRAYGVGENLPEKSTPYWRGRRLYQADRLLQLYGFQADDLTTESSAFFEYDIDPKAAWALRHLHLYPVEINRAGYEELIRVPGIGITNARKIIEARRHCSLSFSILSQMRVSLKRAKYFITCGGKFIGGRMNETNGLRELLCDCEKEQLMVLGAM